MIRSLTLALIALLIYLGPILRGWERNPMQYAGLPGNAIDSLMKRDFAPGPERLRSAKIAALERLTRRPASA